MQSTYITRIKNRLDKEKKKALKHFRIFKKEIDKEQLLKDLSSAGIKSGDTIMIHASLSKIGNVKGGAKTVIEALIEQLGDKGNLVMPAFSYINSMVHTAEVNDYVFDPLTTPSVVGIIPEEFRKWPNVKRSIHPTHSVTCYGPQAIAITEGHLKAPTNFGKGTPFQKMRELKGKTVGIGVGVAYPTFYHSIEDLYPDEFSKVYLPNPKPIRVLVNGVEIEKSIFLHDPEFHKVRIDKNKMIENWMKNHFKEKGILHEGVFGSGNIWWMDIEELLDELLSLAKKGITIYKTPGV